jgi:hypothetical protein
VEGERVVDWEAMQVSVGESAAGKAEVAWLLRLMGISPGPVEAGPAALSVAERWQVLRFITGKETLPDGTGDMPMLPRAGAQGRGLDSSTSKVLSGRPGGNTPGKEQQKRNRKSLEQQKSAGAQDTKGLHFPSISLAHMGKIWGKCQPLH